MNAHDASTSYVEKAVNHVRTAQVNVKTLLEAATEAGNFEEAQQVLTIVRALSEVAENQGSQASASMDPAPPTPTGGPTFYREGDHLVKAVRSDSSGRSYEHRIPRGALEALTARALRLSARGEEPIKAEALSDVRGHDDGFTLPSYQIYLSLGWLKLEGLIKRHGRKGYTIPDPESLCADVSTAWDSLTDRFDATDTTR